MTNENTPTLREIIEQYKLFKNNTVKASREIEEIYENSPRIDELNDYSLDVRIRLLEERLNVCKRMNDFLNQYLELNLQTKID